MESYHHQKLTPSGCSHALSVRLTPPNDSHSTRGTVISHLVTARDSLVQIFEVREVVKEGNATAKLLHILTRRLHGSVTSLARVRTLASKIDGADRVLITFLDAKMSLMEWDASSHELVPISLHTFEKLPQVIDGLAKAATDPSSRLSVLLLPSNTGGDATLAILPFFQEEIDLESLGVDAAVWGTEGLASLPYAPSHLLPLASLTLSHSHFGTAARSSTLSGVPLTGKSPPVRNVIDMVFLPGFTEPTLALLYSPESTWPGRLENVTSNCLISLVTLATGPTKVEQSSSSRTGTTAVVIATSPPLPHSCLAVHPCPPALGGTLVVTANGVLHLEQGGKVIGAAANGWFSKEWLGNGGEVKGEPTVREGLEGAQVVFIANDKALIFCKSGAVLDLTMKSSGRSVSSLKLTRIGVGVGASCVERIRGSVGRFGERGYVFLGSEVGDSSLLAWEIGSDSDDVREEILALEPSTEMEVDDEDDIYGSSIAVKMDDVAAGSKQGLRTGNSLVLDMCDTLSGYGGIRSMAFGIVGEECPPELVACTGGGQTAGLSIFHRTISSRKRRKLDVDGIACRGIWSLLLPSITGGGDSLIITSDEISTNFSYQLNGGEFPDHKAEGATLSAAFFPSGNTIVRVSESEITLHELDFTIRQTLPLDDSKGVVRAEISFPAVLAIGLQGTQYFVFDNVKKLLVEKALPQRSSDSVVGTTLYRDEARVIPLVSWTPATDGLAPLALTPAIVEEDDLYATAPRRALVSEVDRSPGLVIDPIEEGSWSWLPTITSEGNLEILLLPSMKVVFSSASVTLLPEVIENGAIGSVPSDIDPEDVELERVVCANIGGPTLRPHLIIYLKNGSLAVYEGFPSISSASTSSSASTLGVRFVKVLTRKLSTTIVKRNKNPESKPLARREFVPFSDLGGYSGVFLTGEDPLWLLATDHGPTRLFDHAEKGVYAFSTLRLESDTSRYIMQSKLGLESASLPPHLCLDRELPYVHISRDRRYASITFDIDSGLYVAGALFDTTFLSFDEEGEPAFVPDSPELTQPTNYRSALELLIPGSWQAFNGYEFRPNEFISTVKSVSLKTLSTASGRKDFIAVGTTVYRGEDLAARGGIYIFEVVKIVPSTDTPLFNHKFKLLFFEDTKSVVGNVCDIDGYLVMSMGQKLYVRVLQQDEVLLAVGFLDVGVHVTSLQSMKNFLLIGDALQSVTLVAFQDDPYKLVLLGRDYRLGRTTSANFLVNEARLSFVTADIQGVLRIFDYDPTNIASYAGQRLLCRTEYHAGAEAVASLLYAKRSGAEEVKQNGILYGGIDGSLYTLVPVRDLVFRRLQLLQTLLARHVQHFGGLNPRGHRIVKNDSVSRALTKGVLDGELLAAFEALPTDRQLALTAQINTDPDTVLLNLRNLNHW